LPTALVVWRIGAPLLIAHTTASPDAFSIAKCAAT
jgi:hypothetical protein